MQSKISSFFKPSSSISPKPVAEVDQPPVFNNDELSLWETKQHQQLLSTYKRRAPNPQRGGSEQQSWGDDQLAEKPVSDPRPELRVLGKTVTKNKKRSYAQFHIDLGQSDFYLHTCSVCGIMYVTGDERDEKAHKGFHDDFTHGIQFKGWSNERVVHAPKVGGVRIILVVDSDPPAQRNKVEKVVRMMETDLGSGWILPKVFKVYLFVMSTRIVGCLVAEPIKEAHKVLSFAVDGSSFDGTTTNETKSSTLQFGEIRFHREVLRKASAAPKPSSNEHLNGAIICKKEAVPTVCGVRAIWVTPANRRKQIATQLLDALRKSFCMGFVFERSQLAFSQLTSAGRALVSNYIGDGHILVYKTNSVVS